jgi:hypothetical protein
VIGRSERGSVTAETAVALPAVVAVLVVSLTAVTATGARLRCQDAAGQTALLAARGDQDAVAAGRRVAPDGAVIEVSPSGALVRAECRATVAPAGGLPVPETTATAVAEYEPGEPP